MDMVFDSSILIDQLRGMKKANELIVKVESKEITAYISSLTEAELFSGKDLDTESGREKVTKLISLFSKIIVNNEIAQKTGDFRRKYGVPLIDCVIAATSFYQKCKLWTKNKKDFERIKEIEVEEPY